MQAFKPTRRTRLWFYSLAGLALAGGLFSWAFVFFGLYDVSATTPHLRPVYELLELTMRRSVQHRATQAPPSTAALHDPRLQALGAACFGQHCVQCHGAPGVAPAAFALGLQPVPTSLMNSARTLQAQELYWVTRYGIKMSGMPAWEFRLSELELQAVTAFLSQRLPQLSTSGYREMSESVVALSCGTGEPVGATGSTAPARAAYDPKARGELALRQHGCSACHTIPGVTGPDSHVGPSLQGFGRRGLIAGRLPNTQENLVRWIRNPQAIDPNTAMPMLSVSEESARQMAAYLSDLR